MLLMFGMVGCGGQVAKEPKEVLDILKKSEYTLYFKTTENGNYYDEKLKSYKPATSTEGGLSYPDEVVNNYRLIEEPKEISMEIRKGIGIYFSIEGTSIHYTLSGVTYTKDTKTGKETYVYAKEGESGKDKEIKESYTKTLEALDIMEDELVSFGTWCEENIKKEVLEKLQDLYKNKQPLTNDQMKSFLNEQGIIVEKSEDKIYVIDSTANIFIYYLKGASAKQDVICVLDTDDSKSDYVYLKYINDNLEAGNMLGTDIIYNMTMDKGVGGTAKQIEEIAAASKTIKESYLHFLATYCLTEEEFQNFITTYQ